MIQNTTLFLLLAVSILAVHAAGISSPLEKQLPGDSSSNKIPDVVHNLLEKVSENLQDVLKRVLALLGNPTTLPANLVGVLHDVAKILGDVIEALGRVLGFAG